MSYPKKLARLRPFGGLVLDLPANEVGPNYYTAGSNVIFRNGFAQRIGGRRAAYAQNTLDPVFRLLNVRGPGGLTESNFWLAFGLDEVHALETSNVDDVTGSALSAVTSPWQWSATLLNNIPCFTNGLDAPRYWAGDVGTPAADLPNFPAGTICKSLVAFKFHLFALDIDGPSGHLESQIRWSSAAAPGDVPSTWTAAATNDAGSAILADTPGACQCGVPLQDTLLVFKRSSTYGVNYVGRAGGIFSVRLLDGDRGALTRHAAVDVGGRVLVVCDGDVMLTDGVNWQSVAQGRVRDYLFSQLEQASYENLFVEHDRSRNEVWICYPTAGETYCTEAIIYNVATDTFGVRELAQVTHAAAGVVNDTAQDASWDADAGAWDADDTAWNSANFSLANEQLLTAVDGAELTLEDDDTATAIAASVSRDDLPLGAPERFKFVRRVHVRTNGTPGTLYVRVGARNSPTGSIAWGAEVALVPPAAFVNARALGKLISVQARSVGTEVWQLSGLDLEYEDRGYV